ncbi:MAG: glycoside hydrolase family 5 protein [Actinomycetota bacterium]
MQTGRPARPPTRLRAISVVAAAACVMASLGSIVPATSAAAKTPRAVRITGPLHTRGGRILDATGKRVRFLGVGVLDLAPGRGLSSDQTGSECNGWHMPPDEAYANIRNWGFNSVRLAISWANLEPAPPVRLGVAEIHHWNFEYLWALDEVIDEFTSRGIAVIIEMSQNGWSPAFKRHEYPGCPGRGFPAWLYEGTKTNTIWEAKREFFTNHDGVQDMYATAWQVVAKRYANRVMVVGADIMNEPFIDPADMAPEDTNLEAMYEKLGGAIREVAPRILLIFQDNQTRGLHVKLQPDEPPPFANVVYQVHLYSVDWKNASPRMSQWTKVARRWNVPLYMGEFNGFGAGRNNKPAYPGWLKSTNSLMSYCKQNGISWTYWAYWGGTSLTQPGTQQAKPKLLAALQAGF